MRRLPTAVPQGDSEANAAAMALPEGAGQLLSDCAYQRIRNLTAAQVPS
jgi:hypothetical protein